MPSFSTTMNTDVQPHPDPTIELEDEVQSLGTPPDAPIKPHRQPAIGGYVPEEPVIKTEPMCCPLPPPESETMLHGMGISLVVGMLLGVLGAVAFSRPTLIIEE